MKSGLTVFLSLFLVFLSVSAGNVYSQAFSPEEMFSKSLTDYTASDPVVVNEIPDDEDEFARVKSVKILRFKSKKPVSTGPDTYATLALIVLDHGDADAAAVALAKVPAIAEEEMRKSPELDFFSGSKIYRLIGACLLSDESWKAVETKLTDAVFGVGKAPENWVRIACGGKVSVSGNK